MIKHIYTELQNDFISRGINHNLPIKIEVRDTEEENYLWERYPVLFLPDGKVICIHLSSQNDYLQYNKLKQSKKIIFNSYLLSIRDNYPNGVEILLDNPKIYKCNIWGEWQTLEEGLEEFRVLDCPNCENWEEFPADMPRNKSQHFGYVKDIDDNNAVYECGCCGREITSSIRKGVR